MSKDTFTINILLGRNEEEKERKSFVFEVHEGPFRTEMKRAEKRKPGIGYF